VKKAYFGGVPAEVIIKCAPYGNELLDQLKTIPEIDELQGRTVIQVRLRVNEQKLNTNLVAIDEYNNKINILRSKNGIDAPPSLKPDEILLERAIKDRIKLRLGDRIELIGEDNQVSELVFRDYIYDSTAEPYLLEGDIYAYISQDTLEALTGDGRFREIHFTIKGDTSKAYNEMIADKVIAKLNSLGIRVDEAEVKDPSYFFASEALAGVNILFAVLGVLIIVMACALIVNTFNNMMLQQIKTIGIIKSIGGRKGQIIRIYLMQIMIIGIIIYAISLPVSYLIAKAICDQLAFLLNVSLTNLKMPFFLPLALFFSAIIIPMLAAAIPVLRTVRATIYDALHMNLMGSRFKHSKLVHKWITNVSSITIMGRYTIRNHIRDRIRTTLTIGSLLLSACILMTSLNLYQSFTTTISENRSLFPDVIVTLKDYYKAEDLKRIAGEIKEINLTETWAFHQALYIEPSGKTKKVLLSGAEPSSSIINYDLLEEHLIGGELITDPSSNEIVISNHLLTLYPDIKIGDTIYLEIADRKCDFKVAGIVSIIGQPGSPTLFVNYEYLNQLLKGPDMVMDLRFNTIPLSEEALTEVINNLETALNREGIYINEINTGDMMFEEFSMSASIIIALLLLITSLMLMAGIIGLSGSLNINIMERISEFGIIRAIGGSDKQLKSCIFCEALMLTGISWIAGNLLSIPVVNLLAKPLGEAIMGTAAKLRVSVIGIIVGLLIALAVALIACIIPMGSINKTVTRDMLVYE